jgi:hypothetical protein
MTQLPARFANRQSRRQLATAVTAGLGVSSPPYVSIEGGQFTLIDENGEQEIVETKHLDCVIIDTNVEVKIQRVFWGVNKPYSRDGSPPVCFSDNGIGASRNAQEPQSANCGACKWSEWGSAMSQLTGKGVPACKTIKKIAVLVPGWDFPFLLRVPVMSHENLRAYGEKFRGQEFDVSEVTTRVSFVHGAVGQIAFEATGYTDDATEAEIQKILDSKKTDALIGRGDLPISSELPAPKPVQQIAQQGPAAPFAGQQQEPPRRGRKLKAETALPTAPPGEQSPLPPFLQPKPAGNSGPASGIVTNAPPPNADLEKSLASVFGLPTK